jgi:hypothetical protein
MDIEGPLNFSVAAGEGASGYELFLDFKQDFQSLPLMAQGDGFRSYLDSLSVLLADSSLEERTRQGMLIVQQIAEQLLPHVESGDLALNETINIHIRADSPEVSLVDLLKDQP